MTRSESPGLVVVAGGGPAGMEAARVAAERGHRVVLFEETESLGGLLPMAAAPPGRQEFNELNRYLSFEVMNNPKIEVRLGSPATVDVIAALNPKAAIVATGARPIVPPFAVNADPERVFMAHDVLAGKAVVRGDAAIVGAGAVGCETALYLADRDVIDPDVACFLLLNQAEEPADLKRLLTRCGRRIMLVEMKNKIGDDIGKTTRWTVVQDLRRYGVEMMTSTRVEAIIQAGLLVKVDGADEEILPVDSIIIAVGYRAEESGLYADLAAKGIKTFMAGDAKGARKAIDAIREGFDAGMAV